MRDTSVRALMWPWGPIGMPYPSSLVQSIILTFRLTHLFLTVYSFPGRLSDAQRHLDHRRWPFRAVRRRRTRPPRRGSAAHRAGGTAAPRGTRHRDPARHARDPGDRRPLAAAAR